MVLFKIKDISEVLNKIHEWKNVFTKSDVIFFEFWYQVKFDVRRTCGIGDTAFFTCHETTYNHVLTESCDFVHGGMSHHLVEFGSHEPCENRDITFFTSHASIVSCDHCGW